MIGVTVFRVRFRKPGQKRPFEGGTNKLDKVQRRAARFVRQHAVLSYNRALRSIAR